MDVHLDRLVYRSVASSQLGQLHLFHLLTQTQASNLRAGITGHLLYEHGVFIQCIEGRRQAIDAIWQRILRDPRHTRIELLRRETCERRHFGDWSMSFEVSPGFASHPVEGFIPLNPVNRLRLLERCMA